MKKILILTTLFVTVGGVGYAYSNPTASCEGLKPAFADYEKARSLRQGVDTCAEVQRYQRYGAIHVPKTSYVEVLLEKVKQVNKIRNEINKVI